MVNDLIQQKNNLNLNLDPIYVDSNITKSNILISSPSNATFQFESSAIEETKLINNSIEDNQLQINSFNGQDHFIDGQDQESQDDTSESPILPPPPLLQLSATKFLNKSKKSTNQSNSIVIVSASEFENSSNSVHLSTFKAATLQPVKINNSVLKIKKKLNIDTNNGGLIDDENDEVIGKNLNWKFFDNVSLLDDTLRDKKNCGENNFDDCNGATTNSQEVLLSKSNTLQNTSPTNHHNHHQFNKKDLNSIIYNNTQKTTGNYNSTIITNPQNHHLEYGNDKNSLIQLSTDTTVTVKPTIPTKYVEIVMNSPDSQSTSSAVVINNNYTNSNHKSISNNNNNNNNNINSNNHNNYHSINNKTKQVENKKNNPASTSNSSNINYSSGSNIKNINQSGGSIGNLRNDTMIGTNIQTSAHGTQSQHHGAVGQSKNQQQQQQQQQQNNNNSSSLKRNPKSKKSSSQINSGGSGGVGAGSGNKQTATGSQHNNNNNKNVHSVFHGLPDNGIGFHLGLYGWRKKCLYILLLILMLLIIVNLVLTLWILKVMEFSSEGMGQLKIVPGGVQLSGQALIMDLLRASVIRSKHGQPIILESSRNFSINTRDTNGILENHLFLGHDKFECIANGFRINDTTGKNLFSVNRNEVVIGAHHLRIDGEGGVTFRESVQTPHVRAEPGHELRLESPTRQLEMHAAKDINLQSRAGGIDINALDDVKLSSIEGSIRLESSKIYLPNLKPVKLLTGGGSTSFHENFDKVTQLCACSNGKLFLASPKGHCSDDEGTICR